MRPLSDATLLAMDAPRFLQLSDVAEHAPNEARRPASVTGARAVAFGAIAVVRTS